MIQSEELQWNDRLTSMLINNRMLIIRFFQYGTFYHEDVNSFDHHVQMHCYTHKVNKHSTAEEHAVGELGPTNVTIL